MKENSLLDNDDKDMPFAKDPMNDDLLELAQEDTTSAKKPSCFANFINNIFPFFHKVDTKSRRLVYFRNSTNNVTYWSNKEENHKYSLLFFVPVELFNQFKQFANFFYLLLSISQFIPQFKVCFMFTYLSPLCIVILFSMGKELYDDIKRHLQDKKTNATLLTTLSLDKETWKVNRIQKPASELQIGDLIELNKDTIVPADI